MQKNTSWFLEDECYAYAKISSSYTWKLTRYIMYIELCSLWEINFQAFIYSAKLGHKYLEIDKPCKKT